MRVENSSNNERHENIQEAHKRGNSIKFSKLHLNKIIAITEY